MCVYIYVYVCIHTHMNILLTNVVLLNRHEHISGN